MEERKDFYSNSIINENINQKLRTQMLRIYQYMTGALLLSAIAAIFVASSPALLHFFSGNAIVFAPLVFVLIMSFGRNRLSFKAMQFMFWGYALSVGISFSTLFLIFEGESIARVFFISASVFGGMSLYGYTTNSDLTNWGSILYMAVIGLCLTMVVNMFFGSTGLSSLVSFLAVIVFSGLTAYETYQIKNYYANSASISEEESEDDKKIAIMFALSLYINIINIFIHLLHLLGNRR